MIERTAGDDAGRIARVEPQGLEDSDGVECSVVIDPDFALRFLVEQFGAVVAGDDDDRTVRHRVALLV